MIRLDPSNKHVFSKFLDSLVFTSILIFLGNRFHNFGPTLENLLWTSLLFWVYCINIIVLDEQTRSQDFFDAGEVLLDGGICLDILILAAKLPSFTAGVQNVDIFTPPNP